MSAGGVTGAGGSDRVRIRIDVAQDGTDFTGWAAQPGLRPVQGALSAALGTILRTVPPSLTVGGRTDAGVHARGSVAHADIDPAAWAGLSGRSDRSPSEAAVTRLAGVLPADAVVRAAAPVSDSFDARFPRCDVATATGSATACRAWIRCAVATPCGTSGSWTSPRWMRRRTR